VGDGGDGEEETDDEEETDNEEETDDEGFEEGAGGEVTMNFILFYFLYILFQGLPTPIILPAGWDNMERVELVEALLNMYGRPPSQTMVVIIGKIMSSF
jgi:hypothetical protein